VSGLADEKWVREFELKFSTQEISQSIFVPDLITMPRWGSDGVLTVYGRTELGDIVSKARPDDVPINQANQVQIPPRQVPAWEKRSVIRFIQRHPE
jgi:hypothetical protein